MSQANADGAEPRGDEGKPKVEAVVPDPADVDTQPVHPPPPESAELVALREQVATAKAELEQAQARLRAVSKGYNDLQGEMRAFKERMELRSKMDSELQAFDQVKAFFDPVMNLKRSVLSPGEDVTVLVDGLKMVHQQFMESLRKLGLEEVPGVGAAFDPRLHEALATAPVPDKAQDGRVLQVLAMGYTVKSRVLQAAQVVIGKHADPAGEA
jgi:molecular chaperone GrpE